MTYVNRNMALSQFEAMVTSSVNNKINYLPDSFNEQQLEALETFKKRIFLESILDETISFNRKLTWDDSNKNLKLTTTVEELIEVFRLRSDVFTEIGYQNEFPDTIEGLNFDKYDKNSAVIYYQTNNEVTATIRLIFDSKDKLPSEEKVSFDEARKDFSTIGEISRNIVKYRGRGLNQEFKYLMCGIYNIFMNNNIDIALSGIKKEHYKLFHKLGGVDVFKDLESYGSFSVPCLIISYNPNFASKFFKRAFLGQ